MAKKQVEAPSESNENPGYDSLATEAQLYKKAQIKAATDKREAKRLEVLERVKQLEDTKELGIRGRWIVHTEKNGVKSPAIIVSERFKEEGDTVSLIVGAFVYSPNSAQPYRVEITF